MTYNYLLVATSSAVNLQLLNFFDVKNDFVNFDSFDRNVNGLKFVDNRYKNINPTFI